jgi:dTDP-4-dehydrorhamnose 3,5-epimerase
MKIYKTKIKDLLVIKQKNNIDKRGSLRETFNKKLLNKKFVFEYCTTSKKNVLRGFHFQTQFQQAKYVSVLRGFHFQTQFQQAKYVSVLRGKILDVVIDLRKRSKTFGKSFKIILSKENATSLFIPRGFAHAYFSYKPDNIIYYKLDNFYQPKYESGIIYNDEQIRVKWPKGKVLVSPKDKSLKTFKDFIISYKFL